jgi:hypothetical protein
MTPAFNPGPSAAGEPRVLLAAVGHRGVGRDDRPHPG